MFAIETESQRTHYNPITGDFSFQVHCVQAEMLRKGISDFDSVIFDFRTFSEQNDNNINIIKIFNKKKKTKWISYVNTCQEKTKIKRKASFSIKRPQMNRKYTDP